MLTPSLILILSNDPGQEVLCSPVPSPLLGTPGAERKRRCHFTLSPRPRRPADRAPGGLCISRHLPPADQLGAFLGSFLPAAQRPASLKGFLPRRGASRLGRGRGREAPPTAPA